MAEKARIFYVNYYGQPPFKHSLEAPGTAELLELDPQASRSDIDTILRTAVGYQISSGVNDIPAEYRADAALLARTPELLLVSTVGAGYDTVDVAACTQAGVLVVNQAGGANAQAVAEHSLGMMLALARHMPQADRDMRRIPNLSRHHYTGQNTQHKTVGLIGFGNVGRRLARLCIDGLQMQVLVHDTRGEPAGLAEHGVQWAEFDTLLSTADYVVVCCALTEATRSLIGAAQFAAMKRSAYFINTARGGIHDESALLQALEAGQLAGAGIDVWDVEPPPCDHPLLQRHDVLATPHIAGATVESREQAAIGAAEQILTILRGERPPRLLNPDAWPAFEARYRARFGRGLERD